MQKVNWGIIGLGNIALKFAEGFKNIENAKLLGISSKSNEKIKKFKELFKIDNNFCFNSYEDLLSCKDIDMIYIALPNSLHHEWVIRCIEKKKNILVEKPATLNFSEIENIKNELQNKDLLFAEAFMYRFHPQIIKTIELINENRIGKIISVESFFGIDLLTKKNLFGFKKKKKLNDKNRKYNKNLGGGAILDLGCYPVSVSQLIASLVPEIDLNNIKVLNKEKKIGSTGVDLDSYAELQFDNKFISKIGASFTKNLGQGTKVIGEKGELLIKNTWYGDPALIKINGEKNYEIKVESNKNIFSYEIENLSYSIIKNKKIVSYPAMNLTETLLNMRIIDEWLND